MSPVSVKKNSVNPSAGRNCPFSGRLNGVPPFAFASELALKVAVPSTAVSWTVTHVVSNELPYVWRSRMNADVTSPSICAWLGLSPPVKVTGGRSCP